MVRRDRDQFLDHGLQASAFGWMAQRRILAQQRVLSDQSEHVVGQRRQRQRQIVGIELARGQAFEIRSDLNSL